MVENKIKNAVNLIKEEESNTISNERLEKNKCEIMNRLAKRSKDVKITEGVKSAKIYKLHRYIAPIAPTILIVLLFVVSIMFFSRSNEQNGQIASIDVPDEIVETTTETGEEILSMVSNTDTGTDTDESLGNMSYLYYDVDYSDYETDEDYEGDEDTYEEELTINSCSDLVLGDYESSFYFSYSGYYQNTDQDSN